MTTDVREDNLTSGSTAELFERRREIATALGLLCLAIVALSGLGVALALYELRAPEVEARQAMGWPYALFDLLWLVPAGAFFWAARSLAGAADSNCPATPRRLAYFGALVWAFAGLAGGLYQWLTPLGAEPFRAAFAFMLIHAVADLAHFAAWLGVLWILIGFARSEFARTHQRWLVVALGLTAAGTVADAVHFAFDLNRHLVLKAIAEGRGAGLSWPSKSPVENSATVAAAVGLVALLVTLIALLRFRRELRQDSEPSRSETGA